ncbi:MAG: hypothetical protein KKA79_09950 [Nanoarchaeota archaeon]|nr:hypothetical protein [Nanoarchaeota archaeon]MCG2718359.1 hypothetical protein [Nanoarchaeota archaeon]
MGVAGMNPLWVSVCITTVLVCITGYYAWEIRKSRLESIRPIFYLKTGMYSIGGGMHALYLKNMGKVARDINIDIETSNNEKKSFFVPALDLGQEIDLQVNFQQIRENNGFVDVKLKFKDGYNRNLADRLHVDFKRLSKEKREITFQSSPIERHLKGMRNSLEKIERKLS